MTKSERESIRKLFGGKCAYCGKPLGDRWHVDHVTPMFRGRPGSDERDSAAVKYPACRRCNLWKKTFTVEQFRQGIKAKPARLRRDSSAFRLAEDFGLVSDESARPVVFWFERYVPF